MSLFTSICLTTNAYNIARAQMIKSEQLQHKGKKVQRQEKKTYVKSGLKKTNLAANAKRETDTSRTSIYRKYTSSLGKIIIIIPKKSHTQLFPSTHF